MTCAQDSQKHEMDAMRARIHCQSRAAAERIASDAEAQAFLDDWSAPEPLGD